MSGNSFGQIFKITTFGESHGVALGVVIDGCPSGLPLCESDIQKELDKRRVGQSKVTSGRNEPDKISIISGVFEAYTTGTPVMLIIFNKDADSSRYNNLKDIFRPGHADYTYHEKYGLRDYRGGGRSSARETAARVAAGAVAKKILERNGIKIHGYTKQIGDITAKDINLDEIENNIVRCPDKYAAKLMIEKVMAVKKAKDSIGGIVEICAKGVPSGFGEPVFDRLDADLAKAMMSIPAVKGVEIGDGFSSASMTGSQNNDEFIINDKKVSTKTNHAGGILGGISNGMDILIRIAIKPTASILQSQKTVSIKKQPVMIEIEGRHDPCICPRAVPVAESMMALVLTDHLLRNRNSRL